MIKNQSHYITIMNDLNLKMKRFKILYILKMDFGDHPRVFPIPLIPFI